MPMLSYARSSRINGEKQSYDNRYADALIEGCEGSVSLLQTED